MVNPNRGAWRGGGGVGYVNGRGGRPPSATQTPTTHVESVSTHGAAGAGAVGAGAVAVGVPSIPSHHHHSHRGGRGFISRGRGFVPGSDRGRGLPRGGFRGRGRGSFAAPLAS